MAVTTLRRAMSSVPPGRWGVGVSGGADSVALLRLITRRPDVTPIALHLDHAARPESATDAAFVADLAASQNLEHHAHRLEAAAAAADREAHWRRARLAFFAESTQTLALRGVLLAHHADDLAETIALRLLRGSPRSGTAGLAPLRPAARVAGIELRRPLLAVRRRRLRSFLRRIGQPWREDATNAEPVTPRNRLRGTLDDEATGALLDLAVAVASAEDWLDAATPTWPAAVPCDAALIPEALRRRAARRWLVSAGVGQAEATPAAIDRLLAVLNPAGPRAAEFAGGLRVTRRRGVVTRR